MSDNYWAHVDHPEDERYDRVTIDIEPRWKESELSGDEWRFSYVIKVWRKGQVVIQRSFSRLEWAMQALGYTLYIWPSNGLEESFDRTAWELTKNLCDQPGCSKVATVFYKRLKPYTRQGEELVGSHRRQEYRQFCEQHEVRGDCDLDDADHNYERIEDPR